MKISIIVPAYNVEAYIGDCLASITSQAFPTDDYEVVVVDDGSPDGSASIVEGIAREHPQIRLVRQENRGLGGARNTGLREAKGDYVWFVDSDDWITSDSLSTIASAIGEERPDAIAICASNVDADGNNPRRRFDFDGMGETATGRDMLARERFAYCVPFTIYRRDYLMDSGLRFQEHLLHEDNEFTPRAYYGLNMVRLVNEPLYMVRATPGSITRSFNPRRAADLLRVAALLRDFADKHVARSDRPCFCNMISLALNSAFAGISQMDREQLAKLRRAARDHCSLFRCFLKATKRKYRLQGMAYLLPLNPVATYRLLLRPLYRHPSAPLS